MERLWKALVEEQETPVLIQDVAVTPMIAGAEVGWCWRESLVEPYLGKGYARPLLMQLHSSRRLGRAVRGGPRGRHVALSQ